MKIYAHGYRVIASNRQTYRGQKQRQWLVNAKARFLYTLTNCLSFILLKLKASKVLWDGNLRIIVYYTGRGGIL